MQHAATPCHYCSPFALVHSFTCLDKIRSVFNTAVVIVVAPDNVTPAPQAILVECSKQNANKMVRQVTNCLWVQRGRRIARATAVLVAAIQNNGNNIALQLVWSTMLFMLTICRTQTHKHRTTTHTKWLHKIDIIFVLFCNALLAAGCILHKAKLFSARCLLNCICHTRDQDALSVHLQRLAFEYNLCDSPHSAPDFRQSACNKSP